MSSEKKFRVYRLERYINCLKLQIRSYQARAGLYAHNYRVSNGKSFKSAKEAAYYHKKAFRYLCKLLDLEKQLSQMI